VGVKIPVGYGIAAFRYSCVGVTDPIITTLGFRWITGGGGYTGTAANAASTFSAKWAGPGFVSAAAFYTSDYTFQGVDVTMMRASGSEMATEPQSIVGSLAGSAPPVNCAVLVRKSTAMGGRKGRGRMFLPAGLAPEGTVDAAGVLQSGTVTGLQGRLNTFRTTMATEGLPLYLLHDDPAITPNEITSFGVQSKMATQRRRMR